MFLLTDSDEVPADYSVDNEDRIARLSADHGTGEGESVPLTGKQKEEARGKNEEARGTGWDEEG